MALAHVIAVLGSLGFVLYADYHGGRWFRGTVATLPARTVERMHAGVSVGLAALLLTGGLMFIDRSAYLLSQPAFLTKMGFVAALVINGFFIGRISGLATAGPFADLPAGKKRQVVLSGAVSAIGWVAATALGLILGA